MFLGGYAAHPDSRVAPSTACSKDILHTLIIICALFISGPGQEYNC